MAKFNEEILVVGVNEPDINFDTTIDTICCRCYDVNIEVFPANCEEKPEKLRNAPIGMYHCPDCGAMILAGIPHPPLCKRCIDRNHPDFDITKEHIKMVTDFYEERGSVIPVCEKCNLIILDKIVWSQERSNGPSLSSGMFCCCERKNDASE